MQTAYPHHVVCEMTSQDQYVTGVPPSYLPPFPAFGATTQLMPEVPQVPVLLAMGDNSWLVPQPNPIFQPHLQPLQYVTIQPTMVNPPVPHYSQLGKQHPTSSITDQMQGQHLSMTEVNHMLPPVDMRHILVPRRRSGQSHTATMAQSARFPRSTNCERTLRGNNVATRRRSQSQDGNDATISGFGTNPGPVKKCATSAGGNVTSQTNDDVRNWKTPDTRSMQKIVDVMEYYFSDDSLSRNAYLLKQISQQENGFVSLRRIAALKRIKSLTRDVRTVAHCAQQSHKLELSEDGSMVRRLQPLPDSIEAPRFIRTVIAINLPLSNPTIESVTSLFAPFGDLTQVRVLKSGKPLPSYLKDYTPWIPDLGKSPCALVEFESQDEAQKACREINMNNRQFNTLRVALLKPGARLRRTLYRKYKDEEKAETLTIMQSSKENSVVHNEVINEQVTSVTNTQDQSRDYDASASGSDSDLSGHANCFVQKHSTVSDSSLSQSSGDECDHSLNEANIQCSPSNCEKINASDGSDVRVSPDSDQKSTCGLFSVEILRNPIGPMDNDAKGFHCRLRTSLH